MTTKSVSNPDSKPPEFKGRKPKFGQWMRGIYASEENPIRDGMYVETIRRTGRLNSGKYYRLTDGKGKFWEYPAEATIYLQAAPQNPRDSRTVTNGPEQGENAGNITERECVWDANRDCDTQCGENGIEILGLIGVPDFCPYCGGKVRIKAEVRDE